MFSTPGFKKFPHLQIPIRALVNACWETICTPPKFSSPAALFYLAFCPVNSSFLGFIRPSSICSTQGELWALLGSLLLQCSLETLKAVSWDNYRAHLIYFPYLSGVTVLYFICLVSWLLPFYVFRLFCCCCFK